MKARISIMLCLALTLFAFGCDKKSEASQDEAPDDKAKAEAPADQEASADDEKAAKEKEAKDQDKAAEELEPVEVAEAGSKFDPAVQAEQIPAGAYYCDMGTVHWAGMQKPEDGKCPECGMKLKQSDPDKLAAQKEEAVEAHEHGDHAHEGDEHGHDDHANEEEGHGHGDDHGHAH